MAKKLVKKGEYKGTEYLILHLDGYGNASSILLSAYLYGVSFMNNGWHTAYVRVPADHKYFGEDYHNCNLNVHGGLTYAGVPFNQDDDSWWLGWDYMHIGSDGGKPEEIEEECKEAIDQLLEER